HGRDPSQYRRRTCVGAAAGCASRQGPSFQRFTEELTNPGEELVEALGLKEAGARVAQALAIGSRRHARPVFESSIEGCELGETNLLSDGAKGEFRCCQVVDRHLAAQLILHSLETETLLLDSAIKRGLAHMQCPCRLRE